MYADMQNIEVEDVYHKNKHNHYNNFFLKVSTLFYSFQVLPPMHFIPTYNKLIYSYSAVPYVGLILNWALDEVFFFNKVNYLMVHN